MLTAAANGIFRSCTHNAIINFIFSSRLQIQLLLLSFFFIAKAKATLTKWETQFKEQQQKKEMRQLKVRWMWICPIRIAYRWARERERRVIIIANLTRKICCCHDSEQAKYLSTFQHTLINLCFEWLSGRVVSLFAFHANCELLLYLWIYARERMLAVHCSLRKYNCPNALCSYAIWSIPSNGNLQWKTNWKI